jgi:chromosome segregation ATPase
VTLTEVIMLAGGSVTGVAGAVGGPKLVRHVIDRFLSTRAATAKATAEAARDAAIDAKREEEITARHRIDLDVKLEGTTQQQVYELQAWMRAQLEKVQAVSDHRGEQIATLKAENHALRVAVEQLKQERVRLIEERDTLEARVQQVIAQGRDLVSRLAARDLEVARLTVDLADERARRVARENTIAEMQRWIDTAVAERAELEATIERLRASGRAERTS